MSLLQAGIEARRFASSSACEETERVQDGGKNKDPYWSVKAFKLQLYTSYRPAFLMMNYITSHAKSMAL